MTPADKQADAPTSEWQSPPSSASAEGAPAPIGDSPLAKEEPVNLAEESPEAGRDTGSDGQGRPSWIASIVGKLRRRRQERPATTSAIEEFPGAELAESSSGEPLAETEQGEEEQAPPESEAEAETSDEIFAEIGRQLRERREMLSLTHEEIERHTRVRAAFLDALENGSLEELPSPVQTKGILANYAAFLDLDSDSILLRFADGLQARHREQKPQWQPPRTRQTMTVHTNLPPLRSFIASDLLFGVGVAVVLLLFAVWGISRVMSVRTSSPARATARSISEVLAGTPLSTVAQEVTLIPAQDTPLPDTPGAALAGVVATLDPNVAVQVSLATSERTYMRITVDGTVEFEGRSEPNTEYSYQASKQIEVLVGNAAALRVTFNGRDLGLMGSFGEVVDRIYTDQGVVAPTGTAPPTPTATPKVTATPTQTPTPTPSATPTPTSGG